MERWFVSDWHLWDENIIKYASRPFDNANQMNEALLDYHNQFVKTPDHFYMLGDATMWRGGRDEREKFIGFVRRFNGHGRIFLGNHDHWPASVYTQAGFEKIHATWCDQEGLIYSHIPLHPSELAFGVIANVHGHIHSNPSPKPAVAVDSKGVVYVKPYINVSVEVTNYRPIHLDELKTRIRTAIDQTV